MATKIVVDFTNVKDRSSFNPRRLPEGDYLARIVSVDDHVFKAKEGSKAKAGRGWVFGIKVTTGRKTALYPYYVKIEENQLWKLRNLCEAAGMKISKKKVGIDPGRLVGRDIGVSLEDDEYEGKPKSVVQNIFPKSDLPEDVDPESDDDEDAETDEDVEDEDEDIDTSGGDDEEDEEETEEEDEEESTEEDEEEDEPEPEPVKPAKKAKSKATVPAQPVKKAAKKKAEPSDDEDDLDLDDL